MMSLLRRNASRVLREAGKTAAIDMVRVGGGAALVLGGCHLYYGIKNSQYRPTFFGDSLHKTLKNETDIFLNGNDAIESGLSR